MNKNDAVHAIIEVAAERPIVFTTGHACRIARAIADRPNHFYMTGSMGLASSIGLGIARQSGLATVVVDGDGAVLMNPVGLIIAGGHRSLPLVHVVLDDGRYASTGGQAVPSRPDLGALARACGYPRTHEADTADDLTELLRGALANCSAPTFIRCTLSGPELPVPTRVDVDLGDHAARFSTAIRTLARGWG
ncbi:MAG: hypothetical protein GEV28_34255 [Actinophytocola sp.]|uniref:thiamine pyrophosphate-dependent enzyme n=1 Tax=Actinophytocola sp. TaxID=1872138 RepID=UPI0013231A13|nr:thiamine pyrophosphate-dependent enzyme [Actinophytocola sp.]MPZ85178.1 hypothetical protein [Actinophytocola sp.]